MYAHMNVCVHVHMYECIHEYINMCTRVCMGICMYTDTYVDPSLYIEKYISFKTHRFHCSCIHIRTTTDQDRGCQGPH